MHIAATQSAATQVRQPLQAGFERLGACAVTLPAFYHEDLARLADAGRQRALVPQHGLDFASNDYLGLARSGLLRQAALDAIGRGVAIGSGGSRLLRGNAPEHEALETQAARLFGAEAALFTGSGYAGNSLIFSTLPQPGDLILYDERVHASAHEGMRLSRAPSTAFPHNDVSAAADAIAHWRAGGGCGTAWIAFETLYSMDGDNAPVAEFAALAEREGAMLVVDEAHAVGVCGPEGRGLAAGLQGRENVITLVTCGKALGCEGALVLCPAVIRDFLVNRGRGFIFSTAPSPLMAAIVGEALRIMSEADDRRQQLAERIATAGEAFGALGITPSGTHIQPIIIGEDAQTMELAAQIQAAGFDVRGIRPPTVAPGTARLRVSLTCNVTPDDIRALADLLKSLL